jgi:serine/threonine protein kinase
MKRICLRCNVISQDFNLWCQEKYCPAENATEILDNGEWFGPIEIIEPIVILRSAIVYHAQRGEEKILVKIANHGCEDKLRHEARAFLQLAKAGQHPLLPVLLPAHPGGSVIDHPYGWTVLNGKVKYYEVFRFADGEILRNYLLKNPQPWFQHVGWITLSVIDVVYYLHKAGKLHLCLNPDVVLVRFDKQGIPRPMLLDLGAGESEQHIHQMWNENYNLPAYTAPEVVLAGKIGPATDVYGVGMLLYEMLSGRPAHEYHLKKDKNVLHSVVTGRAKATGRVDLKNIPDVAERAIDRQYQNRYPDILAMAQALRPNFPPLPAERKPRRVNWQHLFVVLGALLAISLLVLFAVSMLPQ